MTPDEERRQMIAAGVPEQLLAEAGEVLDTSQMQERYEVQGFAAPFIVVRRRADGVRGTLMFTHRPRWYFGFEPTSV